MEIVTDTKKWYKKIKCKYKTEIMHSITKVVIVNFDLFKIYTKYKTLFNQVTKSEFVN